MKRYVRYFEDDLDEACPEGSKERNGQCAKKIIQDIFEMCVQLATSGTVKLISVFHIQSNKLNART